MEHTLKFTRRKGLCQQFAFSENTSYRAEQAGLIPPPLTLLENIKAWPQYELDAIARAIVGGATQDEIRALVVKLIAERRRDNDIPEGREPKAAAT